MWWSVCRYFKFQDKKIHAISTTLEEPFLCLKISLKYGLICLRWDFNLQLHLKTGNIEQEQINILQEPTQIRDIQTWDHKKYLQKNYFWLLIKYFRHKYCSLCFGRPWQTLYNEQAERLFVFLLWGPNDSITLQHTLLIQLDGPKKLQLLAGWCK